MSLAIDALGKISPWKEAWSFEAKILTIWEDTTIVNENMQKLLHMVLMDKLVRVIRHRFRIIFKCSTSVVAAASTLIPNPGLSLTSIDQILQKCIDYEYLIDFIEVLCGLKKRRDVECNEKILKVMILEVFADGKKISCNFVGDCPALINMNTLKRYQRPTVVILQSFKIKVNGGEELSMLHIYGIASHHFSRLRSNEVGDLVYVIDDESFDWKLIQTIDNLKGNNEVMIMCSIISCAVEKFTFYDKDQIWFLIGEIIDVLKHHKWWYYCCLCNAPVSHVENVFYYYLCRVECVDAIRRYWIKIIVFHSNGSNIFILEDDELKDDYTVPNSMISQLMNKKIVFIVDPRPVGYELNTSLHVIRAICDDVDIVKFLEDSTHDNQQQKFHLDPFVPHFSFEFKNPVEFQSNASIQCSSSPSPPVDQVSPISVLNWNCWMVNHDFHARILSSQGSNLFGNHQPLTIREELRSAFGQCKNTVEAVERMDECSG
ncbi:uncharacterized protein LOC130934285 [Arachis stenosperma]|uniref:uncharacterized protein LOC130934285 n=1 Tax=Arachis stenosperma TaxID=217475 RepID=UPI0025ACD4D4|nr:uncharacterized protein LOC130934285 [Arachis stenosperma]